MPTIKDIARECGVSANTVSSVLNNKPGEVSAQTRERILAEVRRQGYRPSASARKMLGKRTNTIGIADQYTTDSTLYDPYKAHVLEPLVHAARSNRWDVLYYSGHSGEGGFPAFLDGRSDGLIIFTGAIDFEEVAAIVQSGLPVVFIGETQGTLAEHRSAVIDVDNKMGAHLAVSYLTSIGHRRIAMMQGTGISGNLSRVQGYRRALVEQGLPLEDSLIYPTRAWEGSAYLQGIETLSQPAEERPTAIFCFNDTMAFGLLRAAADCGVRVPDELSVVGFDDVTESAVSYPPLTTVRQPLGRIGQRAVEMLIGIIEGNLPSNQREVVQPELIVRASTMPPR